MSKARTQQELREKLGVAPDVLENALNIVRGLYGASRLPGTLGEDAAVELVDKAMFAADYVVAPPEPVVTEPEPPAEATPVQPVVTTATDAPKPKTSKKSR